MQLSCITICITEVADFCFLAIIHLHFSHDWRRGKLLSSRETNVKYLIRITHPLKPNKQI